MNIQPIGKRVLIELVSPEKKTSSGIILNPNSDNNYFSFGKIIELSSDNEILSNFNKDDTIIFSNNSGLNINLIEKKYILLELSDILGIVK